MRFLLSLALLLALPALALAIGGGGGGSGGDSGGSSSSGGASTGGGSTALSISEVACNDAGSIAFTVSPEQEFNVTRLADGFLFVPNGVWSGPTFTSAEVQFIAAGSYQIATARGLRQNFTCPGFKFSCSAVKLKARSCVSNSSGVLARFSMHNETDLSRLKFSFADGKQTYSHSQGSRSPALKGLQAAGIGQDEFVVAVPGLQADQFEVLHQACVGKNYVYSRIACTASSNNAQPVNTAELKCSGYLDLKDRVACRLDLRDAQKDEYANFYPEECKSGTVNASRCLDIYRKVQKCWPFANGPERIACVKQELGLGDLAEERASCLASSGADGAACERAFNDKVYSLVKFRMYNLEEEAEHLAEQGKLDKQKLIDFVVNIELQKRAFNDAKDKAGKRQAILKVRELWRGLFA